MIPFFVADRPMSLRLLKGLTLQDYPGVRIGIMAHANTTENFQIAFRNYPCDNLDFCDAVGGPCQHRDDTSRCPARQYVLNHTVKMCDSGIFTREGATLTYDRLFEAYGRMGVEYGVMIDVFQDPHATLQSAERALEAYEPYQSSFILVGVAHGATVEEYAESYKALKEMGFSHVAVGGLLQRVGSSVRYTQVRDETFMYEVLAALRVEYQNDWLFALGCFHPNRLAEFARLNVWGDYKGWIFKYRKRNEALNTHIETFASNHLEHLAHQEATAQGSELQRMIVLRDRVSERQKLLSQELFKGRRALREALRSLHKALQKRMPEMATRFESFTTHGLLSDTEEKLTCEALKVLGKEGSEEADRILANIRTNRELKEQVKRTEDRINQVNTLLAKRSNKLVAEGIQLTEETKQLCTVIASLINRTEREHRFEQVRTKIAKEILASL